MSLQTQINQIVARLNAIATSARNIFQLPLVSSGQKWVAVFNENGSETQRINLNDITSQAGLPNGIVTIGTREIIDDSIFFTGFQWRINSQITGNNTTVEIPLNLATDSRFDVFFGDVNGNIFKIEGEDSETPEIPNAPTDTVVLSVLLVTDSSYAPEPIPDTVAFVQKNFFNYEKIRVDLMDLPADGRTNFVIENPVSQEFNGFNIPTGHEHLFVGKRFIFRNLSGDDFALQNAEVDLPFFVNVTLADNDWAEFDYFEVGLRLVSRVAGGSGGTTIHNELTGRDESDAHPISAITGLGTALDARLLKEDLPLTPTAGVINTTPEMSDRVLVLNVGSTATTFNINHELRNVGLKKKGSGVVTFVSGAGRTLNTLTSTDKLTSDGAVGLLFADGTVDNLFVNDGTEESLLKSGYKDGVLIATDFTLVGGVMEAQVSFVNEYPDANYTEWINFRRVSGSLFSLPYVTEDLTTAGFKVKLNTGTVPTGLVIIWQTFRNE